MTEEQADIKAVLNAIAIMANAGIGTPREYYELLGHPDPESAVAGDEKARKQADDEPSE